MTPLQLAGLVLLALCALAVGTLAAVVVWWITQRPPSPYERARDRSRAREAWRDKRATPRA